MQENNPSFYAEGALTEWIGALFLQTAYLIKLIRTEAGLTQDRTAEMIGISKKTLVQVEKGTNPRFHRIRPCCRAVSPFRSCAVDVWRFGA